MVREAERIERAAEAPIVGSLPEVPGIGVAMRLTPELGVHLRGLADALLVNDYPGATIVRAERELLATAVSAANDCFFCMDSHGVFASALLGGAGDDRLALVDEVKCGTSAGFEPKMAALLAVARTVRESGRALTAALVDAAREAGASDGDVQLAVLIAAGFSMYNRLVDGLRARTPALPEAFAARAGEIAEHGYSWTPPAPPAPPATR